MAESIRVRVRIGGSLAAHAGTDRAELELGGRATLREIAARVGLEPNLVMLYVVNGVVRPATHLAADGDEVMLVPAIAGGAGRHLAWPRRRDRL